MAGKKDDDDDKKKKKGKGDDGPGADDFQPSTETKQVLGKAKRGAPISCAIALTKDKVGIIVVDKKRKGKKLLVEIKRTAKDNDIELETTSLRFGKALVDLDVDATLVTFKINKDAGGAMRKPLLDRLKECGFTKIELIVDAALENESDEDEPDEAPAAPGAVAGAAAGAAIGGAASMPPPPPQPASPAAGPAAGAAATAPKPEESEQDAKILTNLMIKLMALGGQVQTAISTTTDDIKGPLLQIMEKAKAAIVAKDVKGAQGEIATLEEALKHTPNARYEAALKQQQANSTPPGGKSAQDAASQAATAKKLDTAHKAWGMFLTIADKQKDKLFTEVSSMYQDHGFGAEVDKFFSSQVEPAMKKLKDSALPAKLAAATKSADPQERKQLLSEGVKIIEDLQKALTADPVLTKLDNNPFTPLGIAKAGNATLEQLKTTLTAAAA